MHPARACQPPERERDNAQSLSNPDGRYIDLPGSFLLVHHSIAWTYVGRSRGDEDDECSERSLDDWRLRSICHIGDWACLVATIGSRAGLGKPESRDTLLNRRTHTRTSDLECGASFVRIRVVAILKETVCIGRQILVERNSFRFSSFATNGMNSETTAKAIPQSVA